VVVDLTEQAERRLHARSVALDETAFHRNVRGTRRRDNGPVSRVRSSPRETALAVDQLLGHPEVVIDAQVRLTALLLQYRLEAAGLVHERAWPALRVEFPRQHLAVPQELDALFVEGAAAARLGYTPSKD